MAHALEFFEEIGNLFEAPFEHDALAHCVSQDLAMSKGIAVEFKQRFGHVLDLKAQAKQVGEVAVLPDADRGAIFYLVTKYRYFDKPTLATLKQSLEALRQECLARNIQRLTMPRIGCGLDRLSWNDVRSLLTNVFANVPLTLTVVTLD